MGVTHEQIEAFLLGQSVSPAVQAEIEQQSADPDSPLSVITRRFSQAVLWFADADGPLLTAIAPPIDATFDQLAEVNNHCAACLRERRWNDAYPLRLTTCRLALRFLGEGHRDTATYINSLGRILYERGEFDRAVRVYEHALDLRSRYLGERHSDTGISWAGLGRVLEALAQYDDARECHRFALEVTEEYFGPNHPDTGVSLRDLGCVSLALGDLDTAETCFQRATNIAREIEGDDDPIHAGALMHFGALCEARQNLTEAERLYQQALTIYEFAYGPDHSDVAWCLDYLGGLRLQRGDLPAAEQALQRAAQILESAEHSPMLNASVLSNLAVVLHLLGKQSQARKTSRKALNHCRKFLGREHPTTLISERNLTLLEADQRQTRRVKQETDQSTPAISPTRFSVQSLYVPFDGQTVRFFQLSAAA